MSKAGANAALNGPVGRTRSKGLLARGVAKPKAFAKNEDAWREAGMMMRMRGEGTGNGTGDEAGEGNGTGDEAGVQDDYCAREGGVHGWMADGL